MNRCALMTVCIAALAPILGAAPGPVPVGGGQVLLIVGPPGSGKSVQAGKLSKKYKVPVISVTQLVKDGIKNYKAVAGSSAAALASGEMLDDKTAVQLVSARINQPDAARGFILDGFPVSEVQAKHLDSFIASQGLQVPKVVVLAADDSVVRVRLLKRKRADDTPENIDRRLKDYHREEAFLNSWYTPANTLRVDATKPPDQVFAEMDAGLTILFRKKDLKTREPETR
jgi:adenylate kinase